MNLYFLHESQVKNFPPGMSRSLLDSYKLYNIGSLDHVDQRLWECGDLQRCCCHGNSVRKYIYV